MRFDRWVITRHKIKITPVHWYWKGLTPKKVPVYLDQMPVVYWLLLRDVVFNIESAPYIIGTYLDIAPGRVAGMKAGNVIALFNHVKSQVEKCNKIFEWAHEDLLSSSDNVDNSHFDGLSDQALIFDLMEHGNKTMKEAEQVSFSEQMNYLKIRNAYIRTEQNRNIKNKIKR